MANEFPDATITGIDMSAIFPTTIIPENCRFLQHNIISNNSINSSNDNNDNNSSSSDPCSSSYSQLPFPDNSFDFVFQRLILTGLTPQEWADVLKELERVTKPGGWIELVEVDAFGGNNGPYMTKIWNWLDQAFKSQGVDTSILIQPGLVSMMQQDIHLVNVSQEVLRLPTGHHGGKIGVLLKENEQAFWNAISPAVFHHTTAGLVDTMEFEEAVQMADAEMEVHKSYHIFYIAYGQKRDTTTTPAAALIQSQTRPQQQQHQHHPHAVAV
ncbi:hypothetical protein BG004_007659, partial [Podila humilis]